jgi:hypothetical protein
MATDLTDAFKLIESHTRAPKQMLMDEETLKSFEDTTAPNIRQFATWVWDDEEPTMGWWEVNLPGGK